MIQPNSGSNNDYMDQISDSTPFLLQSFTDMTNHKLLGSNKNRTKSTIYRDKRLEKLKKLKSKAYQSPSINKNLDHRTQSHNRLSKEVQLSMKVLQSTMTGPNNQSSMVAVESGLSKELGGSIKTNKTSSNDKTQNPCSVG